MHNYSKLDNSIKTIIKNLINNLELTDLVFGKVTSDEPLEIKIDQKITLNKNQLILTRNVTDYETELSFDNPTIRNEYTTSSYPSDSTESTRSYLRFKNKDIKNEITIYNKLKIDEKVILLKLQGGQRFLVLDRVGEW